MNFCKHWLFKRSTPAISRKSIPRLAAIGALQAGSMLIAAPAHAEPISTFFIGLAYGLGSGGIVAGTYLGALGAGYAVGAFLATPIGGLLLSVGLQALGATVSNIFAGSSPQQQQVPQDSARVNVRIEKATRWLHAGLVRAGGAVLFGEFDDAGYFWYIVALGDSELLTRETLMFDDLPLTLDSFGRVETNEFCLNVDGGIYSGTGDRMHFFRTWIATFAPGNPVPSPIPPEFTAKFPEWTADHKMAGTTLGFVRITAVSIENRHKIYRWRGAFGLGEPALSVVGIFSRIYDPRNPAHDIDVPATWGPSKNSALIWAWFWTHPYGFNKPMSSVNWTRMADAADKCDVPIQDKYGNVAPRYECGISIPDTKQRSVAQGEILATCDGMLMFDDQGRAYVDVGVWREPSLLLTAARDVLAMSSREAEDGESETDGVVVEYIEPEYGYIRQPSAPWINPDFYEEGRTPNFLTVEVLGCQNHNQAVRLAKAIGKRSQALQRLAPVVGLRGLLARRERIVSLDYDETFSGNYEIVSPVELDEGGYSSALFLVPVDQNRWKLLPGEEGDKPALIVDTSQPNDLALPAGLSIYAAIVPASDGNIVRLEAIFDTPPRVDHRYQFDYRKLGETAWRAFVVNMTERVAYTEPVDDGETFEVRFRTVSTAGGASDYVDPIPQIVATADPDAPGAVTDVAAFGGAGVVDLSWVAPNSPNYFAARVYRHTIDNFAAATVVRTEYGGPSAADSWQDSALAAGTYYYWIEAINGSGVAAAEEPTGSVTVT